jgi:hypothetical protein
MINVGCVLQLLMQSTSWTREAAPRPSARYVLNSLHDHVLARSSPSLTQATTAQAERVQKLVKLSFDSTSPAGLTATHPIEAPTAAPSKKRARHKSKKTAEERKQLPPAVLKKVNALIGEPIALPRLITKEKLLHGLEHLYQDETGVWHRKQRVVGEGGEVIWITEEESEAAAALTSMFESVV